MGPDLGVTALLGQGRAGVPSMEVDTEDLKARKSIPMIN
jgi:hypothetical protein